MKKKIGFLVVMLIAVVSFTMNSVNNSNNSIDLTSLIQLAYADGEQTPYSCEVEKICDLNGSSVSCTGVEECKLIFRGVKCDGRSTFC